VLGDLDAVDHERDQVQPGQVGGEQLGQGMLGRGHEPARDRRLGGPAGGLLDPSADRFQPVLVAAGGQLGQHPLQGELVQQLRGTEHLPGRQRQLAGTIGAAHPRAVDPHPPPPAQGDPAGLGAVADRDPLPVVAAPWANQPVHLGVQQAAQHLQARAHREREQPVTSSPGQFGEPTVTCAGSTRSTQAGRVECVSFGMWRSPPGRAAWPLPDTYHMAGIRRGPPPQVLRSPGQPQSALRERSPPSTAAPPR
jgi:hypothetical protein